MLLNIKEWQTWPEAVRISSYDDAKLESLSVSKMRAIITKRQTELKAEIVDASRRFDNPAHQNGMARIIKTFSLIKSDMYPDNLDELNTVMLDIYRVGVSLIKPRGTEIDHDKLLDLIRNYKARAESILEGIDLGLYDNCPLIGNSQEKLAMTASAYEAKRRFLENILEDPENLPRTEEEFELLCLNARLNESAAFRAVFRLDALAYSPAILKIIK